MARSLRSIFAESFRLDEGGETLVISPGGLPVASNVKRLDQNDQEVRRRLMRHVKDDDCLESLKRKVHAWGFKAPGTFKTSQALVEEVAEAVRQGRLTARILPTGISDLLSDSTSVPQLQARRHPSEKPGKPVHRMTPVERLAEMLWLTAPKLPDDVSEQYEALLTGTGVMRIAMVLAEWLASHLGGAGWVVDVMLAAALIELADLTAQQIEDAVIELCDAIATAVNASTEEDLDRAATRMAAVIASVGVALLAVALGRGTRREGGGAAGKSGAGRRSSDSTLQDAEARKADWTERLESRRTAWQARRRAEVEAQSEQEPPGGVAKPNPQAIKPYRDNPGRLEGKLPAEVEKEFDQTLVKDGHWTKSPTRDGNGIRYLDGKGASIIINKGYPQGLLGGGGNAVHQGPYVKIQPGNIRVPLAGNPAAGS